MQPEGLTIDVTLTRGVQAASAPLPVSEGTFGEHNVPYKAVFGDVSKNIDAARDSAAPWVNAAYWLTGRRRVEFEQSREERAEYRTALVERLSVDLTTRPRRGFYRHKVQYMRLFYLSYPPSQIRQTPYTVWHIRSRHRRSGLRRPSRGLQDPPVLVTPRTASGQGGGC